MASARHWRVHEFAALKASQCAITIHSSRLQFVARLNSGVRRFIVDSVKRLENRNECFLFGHSWCCGRGARNASVYRSGSANKLSQVQSTSAAHSPSQAKRIWRCNTRRLALPKLRRQGGTQRQAAVGLVADCLPCIGQADATYRNTRKSIRVHAPVSASAVISCTPISA